MKARVGLVGILTSLLPIAASVFAACGTEDEARATLAGRPLAGSDGTAAAGPVRDHTAAMYVMGDTLAFPVPRELDLSHVQPEHFAVALGDDPIRIFEFVRDHVAFEPYPGVLRGPRGTLMAMAGNSSDQAALLAAMLEHAGQRVRFAEGTLPPEKAGELVRSIWERRQSASVVPEQAPSGAEAAFEDLRASVERDYRLLRDRLEQAGRPSATTQPSADSVAAEVRSHHWVQWWRDGEWVDLDPAAIGPAPGETWTVAERTFETLPEGLFHRLQFRVVVEEYTDGVPSRREVLTRSARAVDLSGRDLVLAHQPENWNGPAPSLEGAVAAALENTGRVKPILIQGDEWLTGETFLQRPPTGGLGALRGMLGGEGTRKTSAVATAEWIEWTFSAPGGSVATVTREVFDVVGPERRRTGEALTEAELRERIGSFGAFDPTFGLYDMYVTTGSIAPAHLPLETALSGAAGESVGDLRTLLRRINALYATGADALLSRLSSRSLERVLAYPVSPRLQILEVSQKDGGLRIGLDLRRREVRFLTQPADARESFWLNVLHGVVEGALEREVLEQVITSPEPPGGDEREAQLIAVVSTSTVFERAQVEGVEVRLMAETGALDELPADSRARVQADLANGFWVVGPERPVMVGGGKRYAWWRLDPATGATTGVTDEGLHGASRAIVAGLEPAQDATDNAILVAHNTSPSGQTTLVFEIYVGGTLIASSTLQFGVGWLGLWIARIMLYAASLNLPVYFV